MLNKREYMNYVKPDPNLYGIDFTFDGYNGMPYRKLGNSGLRVSNIGLGTWKLGLPESGDGARVNEKTGLAILDAAITEGVTFWDTANRYNNASGNSERVIGRWLSKNVQMRRNVVLATKLFGATEGTTPNHCRLSRANILESTYASLDRLQTDYIDVMYFHSFDDSTAIEESLMAIEDLVSQDLVRCFGVSNFTLDNLESYAKYSNEFKRAKIQVVQNRYDILYKESDAHKGGLDFCEQNKISFVPWGPLRQGLLSERYLDKSKVSSGDRLFDEKVLEEELTDDIVEKLQNLNKIAYKYNMSLSQQTLAYMLQLPAMGSMIVASSTVDQLKENAKAGKITLSDEQIVAIEKIV